MTAVADAAPDPTASEPLRGEIYSLHFLTEHARVLASGHVGAVASGPVYPLLDEFQRTRDDLLAVYRQIELAAKGTGGLADPSPAEEWLLDNFHVVDEQLREIVEDLPTGYLVRLPRLPSGSTAGFPRVYLLALDLVTHTDARLDRENLLHYVEAYQEHAPLTIGELWAVPIMLRLSLVENLRRLARHELAAREERALADEWADRLFTQARARSSHGVVALAQLAVSGKELNDVFVSQLIRRLWDEDLAMGPTFAWIEDRLAEAETSVDEVIRRERHRQASYQVSVGNSITSMRIIGALDWAEFFEHVSRVERELRLDPVNAYGAMDPASRDSYRREVEKLAVGSGIPEIEVARKAVAFAARQTASDPQSSRRRHVGYYLVDDGRLDLERDITYRVPAVDRLRRAIVAHPMLVYLGFISLITLALTGAATMLAWIAGGGPGLLVLTAFLVLAPASELALSLVNLDITAILRPRALPKLLLEEGIPDSLRTVVAVPTLLADQDGARKLVADIEIRFLANQDPNLHFALLTDFVDAGCEEMSDDQELLDVARKGILELDQRYADGSGGRFFLLHRRRRWNPSQGVWMGWERKRGKLEELNRLLRGARDTDFAWVVGDIGVLREARYVITLDADTQLPRDSARRLIGTIAHPLNRACFDASLSRVVEGYGIVQPRVSTNLVSAGRSLFSRVLTGNTGLDPYAATVSDTYQDLFGEGNYYGKGIYDVDAFRSALEGRVPANRLLSHDLFEGLFARVALASDIELFDDYPSHYAVYAAREHRWIRGDWQLIPWLGSRVPAPPRAKADGEGQRPNDLPPLGRWKLFDNLRRSLVPPWILALLLAGWTALPGPVWVWTGIGLSAVAFPALSHVATSLLRPDGGAWTSYFRGFWGDLKTPLLQVLIAIAVLPHQAVVAADAIARTLVRVMATGRNLLLWETAAEAERRAARTAGELWRTMWAGPLIAIAAALLIVAFRSDAIAIALPLVVAWLALPIVVHQISRPTVSHRRALSQSEVRGLRQLAWQTWRFFETFVTEEDNWLPPDNYQEDPRGVLAHRTSPTNIGLYLLSALAARDFGYLALSDLSQRLEQTLNTMGRMDQYRGHLYNWYDTESLEPLQPLYVSTVDSGNLVGYLLALRQGCEELIRAPVVSAELLRAVSGALELHCSALETAASGAGRATGLHGKSAGDQQLEEFQGALEGAIEQPPSHVPGWIALLDCLLDLVEPTRWVDDGRPGGPTESRYWLDRVARLLRETRDELGSLGPLSTPAQPTFESDIPSLADLASHSEAARSLTARLRHVSDLAEALVQGTDFQLVFDPGRRIFSIGFNVVTGQLDHSWYDLFASEARLASLVAIALDQVPQEHWFRLGRQLAGGPDGRVLLSWSGTMFEYLMPLLVMRRYPNTLLDETYSSVVSQQIAYGERHGVPWGVSESAFNTLDLALNYQYRAFGVPGLGLKPGLGADLVVSPYATALALPIAADAAAANLNDLSSQGMKGRFGLYEAIDYTRSRVPPGRDSVIVRAFMAHHEGMSLVALDNELHGEPMVRRFHADPRIRTTELLLQERVPGAVGLFQPRVQADDREALAGQPDLGPAERIVRLDSDIPSTLLLSNGVYSVMVTAAGGCASTYKNMAVNRWREDPTLDSFGSYCYVRLEQTDGAGSPGTAVPYWSTTFQPTRVRADEYSVVYAPEAGRFRRRDGFIETVSEVVVSPECHAEVRRVTLANLGDGAATLAITSYTEVALAERAADLAHPAFGNLFVETEYHPGTGALLCSRRPRSVDDEPVWLVHVSAVDGDAGPPAGYETSRARFVGRGRDASCPLAMEPAVPLSNTVGAVLDPAVSLRRSVTLAPGERAVVSFSTAVADSREAALELADKFSDPRAVSRTFELAWTDSRVELRHLSLAAEQALRFQELASSLIFHDPSRRAPADVLVHNVRGQPSLWPYGISGDFPILLLRVDEPAATELVQELLVAHEYWRLNGLSVDLVILNEDPGGYLQPLQDTLLAMVQGSPAQGHLDQPGGVFVRRTDLMPNEDRVLLQSVARVVLATSRGRLSRQLGRPAGESRVASEEQRGARDGGQRAKRAHPSPLAPHPSPLEFFNGRGGFTANGSEYVIDLGPGETTPAPWINVVANPELGCLVSESGSGFTWQGNSQSNRLTPWSNDPVSDPAGEALFLCDVESGDFWTPTPLPSPSGSPHRVRHGLGYTRFEHSAHELESELTLFVHPEQPIKLWLLRVRNQSDRPRRLTTTMYVEWVLGAVREHAAMHVVTQYEADSGALFARNRYVDQTGRVAFLAASEMPAGFTADRTEFLGRNGSRARPAALDRGELSGRVGAGLDPCGVIQVAFDLTPGESREMVFLLGQGRDAQQARSLIRANRTPSDAAGTLEATAARWSEVLGAVQVKTPDRALDVMLNGWLLYQALGCRTWARSAFYQSSGAYGFRDQLQDVLALNFAWPTLAREHILRAAARQFLEGDVQHWWHPETGQGVRTRCSDDLLWLPYVTAAYVKASGDRAILDEILPFLESRPLEPDEREQFGIPAISEQSAPLYEHCVRAIERGTTRGPHDLPLIGDGDWNDGMNRVGHGGRGESVWMAWFLGTVLSKFVPICETRGDSDRADRFQAEVHRLCQTVEQHAWDGAWYRRAYFDDGTPLGSAAGDECRIDAIAQAWSVISGLGDPTRARTAMQSLDGRLIRPEDGLILLLTPPFDRATHDPGYIKGYLPGVRENGGQYTHGALWTVLATAILGDGDRAVELLSWINPVNRARTPDEVERYRVEPYAVAADVYAASQHVGRGGWTWYTGSAGWMYRIGLETILGLHLEGSHLRIDPTIPKAWSGYEVGYRRSGTTYTISVENPDGVNRGVVACEVDGMPVSEGKLPLSDDGREHRVRVVLG